MRKQKKYSLLIVLFILVNVIGYQINKRFDFTKDAKYSLSEATKKLLATLNDDIYISVYLTGDLPHDFKRLATEATYFLNDLKNENKHIHFRFIDPKGKEEALAKQRLNPSRLTVQQEGKISESFIYPWATLKKGTKTARVNLLKDSFSGDEVSQIENSIQNLEFAFAEGIQKLTTQKKQKIAILKGNGELQDIYQYDFLKTLSQRYFLAPFILDSVHKTPEKTLAQLQTFDLAIINKPTKAFSEQEKFALDQFTIKGGKTLWLLDLVSVQKDSLLQNGKTLAHQIDLNLTDYLFNYGVRIQKNLVKDLYAAEIPIVTGKVGNKNQLNSFLWNFYPIISSKNNHVITKNIGDVKLSYTSSIDTLKPSIQKTVLLQSSPLTQTFKVPNYINLASITKPASPKNYAGGAKTLGILLEGNFQSAYTNRVKPFTTNFKNKGTNNRMIVIADGDIGVNPVSKGKPLELGLDKWTKAYYANKEFLTNAVSYLLNNEELIQLKAKKIKLRVLNKLLLYNKKTKWQVLNIVGPVLLILIFGAFNFYYRKAKHKS